MYTYRYTPAGHLTILATLPIFPYLNYNYLTYLIISMCYHIIIVLLLSILILVADYTCINIRP